ncbi:MAG: WD40 repeat domain-containing protein [Candidatus Sungiibacteriota bacterium]|uniref:WD40 repeat domain-containing protein n=1 Tax=Candidatus Sungiibacteriota bacterium TaxID=2750080 RepID=A0A7T5RJM2_9BACT|nr:MAG: WD40 repeat domain-containing protein [Candidatus Sungbacteria bacterium]
MEDDIKAKKRKIYIVIGAAAAAVLGVFIYRALAPGQITVPRPPVRVTGRASGFPAKTLEEISTLKELKPGEELSVGPEQKLIKLTDFSVISTALNKEENKILFYKKDGGDLFASDFTGRSLEKISNITVVGMVGAVWSPSKDRAAVIYLDGETLRGFLHIGTSSVAVLPQNIQGFSWSPDGKAIAYILPLDGKLSLTLADASGKKQKVIAGLPPLDASIRWVAKDTIALETAASGLAEGYLLSFTPSSGLFKKILGPNFGLTTSWSSDGSRLLASYLDSAGGIVGVGVYAPSGELIASTGLITLPEKCFLVPSNELFCAVPRDIPSNSVWPDEYLRGELNTADRILSFDLKTGATREIFDSISFDVSELLVTKNKEALFFINRLDGTLWALKLR